MIDFFKKNVGLALFDTELADPVVDVNAGIPHGDHRNHPLISVSAVGVVDDTVMICLNNAEVLVGTAARDDMGFIPFRELHGNPEPDQTEIPFFEVHILCRAQIDPVGAVVRRLQLLDPVAQIADPDFKSICS